MITMIAVASCLSCPWHTEPSGDWDAVQKQADKHLAAGHPVSVTAIPRSERPAEAGRSPQQER